jgi:hypothetical protein
MSVWRCGRRTSPFSRATAKKATPPAITETRDANQVRSRLHLSRSGDPVLCTSQGFEPRSMDWEIMLGVLPRWVFRNNRNASITAVPITTIAAIR